MTVTVFAENMGLFHKGSGGKGVAPADVCLSPPPSPTGPLPVPYVNTIMASNLVKGSKSVKVDGQPTALEDKSNISTSTGNEPGNQGGNVITHKTKGKGYFKLWSFTVQIEGMGVDRHGDPMGQNSGSDPPGCVDAAAVTTFLTTFKQRKPCKEAYSRNKVEPPATPNGDQKRQVRNQRTATKKGKRVGTQKMGVRKCWTPGCSNNGTIADHQPPLSLAWYLGGCHAPIKFKKWAHSPESIKGAHCDGCSEAQMRKTRGQTVAPGGTTGAIAAKVRSFLGI